MKRFSLAPITIFTLILTGGLLPCSGWFASRDAHRPPSHAESHAHFRDHDLTSEAALRFRSGQPTHWRALALHHQ
jgi:hypothetical protein